ncbi:MAG: hypothetical protein IKC98_01785 [Firmicutes bacterium]|nr:hypothetical protein [Bacillota bacterium]
MKACLAQLYTVKGDPAANLAKMSAAIKEAAAKGADLVCFSELFYCGYDISREELRGLAIYVDGPELAKVRAMAADAGVHVLISYPEKDKMSDDVFISASLIDDAGNILLNHRKTYRWGDEKDKVSGGSGYEVCDTKFGKIGVLICYEIEFPEPARILMLQGAELILTTSAFTYVENMPTYLSALAIQNQCYVLSTNDVREEAPKRGASCALDQYGKVINKLDDNEGMLYCDIDLDAPGRRASDPHMRDLDRETFRMMVEAAGSGSERASTENTPGSVSKKYIKRPIPIKAYQADREMIIHTLEGDMKAMPGDYIVTGVKGEQYPVKKEIFEKTYEEAE